MIIFLKTRSTYTAERVIYGFFLKIEDFNLKSVKSGETFFTFFKEVIWDF